ncbi:unnamed protein product [Caenorhabditis angaria]|uniref:BTB domain-containing protein n=1 Tax=Caenorhabditis angaria TaxID=860376 RepID=A0A9P1IF39_9PELO|nr:unnamed protein product [Caenorhabditis angaria]
MNGTLICYTKESHAWGWDQFLKWSDLPTSYNSKIEFITVECQFSFKYYDFSKNPAIFSDASFKGGTDEYHISKGYFCTYSKFFNEKFVKNNETTITIDDVKSEEFLMLLAALLPDPTTITSRNYDILQNLTEKFEICSLAKRCDDYFKKNQCSEIIEKIKKAEQKNDTKSIPTILSTVNRGRELKILWQDEYYEHFEDITKLACADVAFKFL